MSRFSALFGLMLAVVWTCGLTASAQSPADRTIRYRMHVTPTEPSSAVEMDVRLFLTAADRNQTQVGWSVSRIEFRLPALEETRDYFWSKDLPLVSTPDGLWWVDHVDPNAPQLSEFALLPLMVGTAKMDQGGTADLEYSLVGEPYPPPPFGLPPYPDTVSLTFEVAIPPWELWGDWITDWGEAEPAELNDVIDPN